MNPRCPIREHLSRRQFLKSALTTAGGLAVANWGGLFHSQTIAAEAKRQGKRCILLWMAGGPSHLDTFDMKPGRPVAGPFRPIATNVAGIQICEYLPGLAKQTDKLAIIRSMSTSDPGHSTGTYLLHTGYPKEPAVRHPELGAMVAKYNGDPDADLPSFIQMGIDGGESSPNAGSGFLGPAYQPFRLGDGGRLPENTTPYLSADAEERRRALLRFVEEGIAAEHGAGQWQAFRAAQEKSYRLLKAKGVFDISSEPANYRDKYGDTKFGRNLLTARRLVEAGVSFVEVEQPNYDSHSDNFEWHKALLPVLDRAWSALLEDLKERGLLQQTLVVWMGEFGRTPNINNRAGRDHYSRAWSAVLAGGGVKGGLAYGQSDADGKTVVDKPVNEGDLFATIYTALGVNPRVKHFVGSRPIWATPETAKPLAELLG
jgi:hypothetical protein